MYDYEDDEDDVFGPPPSVSPNNQSAIDFTTQVSLADYLKMSISDIQKMSLIEFKTWLAYFQIRKTEEQAEMRKQSGNKRANNIRRR